MMEFTNSVMAKLLNWMVFLICSYKKLVTQCEIGFVALITILLQTKCIPKIWRKACAIALLNFRKDSFLAKSLDLSLYCDVFANSLKG